MTTLRSKYTLLAYCGIALNETLALSCGTAMAEKWTLRTAPPIYSDGSEAIGPALLGVSCPTDSLCVAVGLHNTLAFSEAPTGDASRWRIVPPPVPANPGTCVEGSPGCPRSGSLDFDAISCGTPSLCVAVARNGRILVSTESAAGAQAWREIGSPGGPGNLGGVDCLLTSFCAVGNMGGNVLASTNPPDPASRSEANAGLTVLITDISCPTAQRCLAVDSNGDVLTSTEPFLPPEKARSIRKALRRPRTTLIFTDDFAETTGTRRARTHASFRFYSRTQVRGFECKRDSLRYRPCRSPLRYWVPHGRFELRGAGHRSDRRAREGGCQTLPRVAAERGALSEDLIANERQA